MAFDIVGGSDDAAASAYDQVGDEGAAQSGNQQIDARKLPRHFAGAGPIGAALAAAASVTATFNLNMFLRPDKLVIPDAIAPSVAVVAMMIGAINLNAGSDPCPGDMFRHNSTGGLRGAVSGGPSLPIKVTIINSSAAALPAGGFYLGLQGPVKRAN
jgi:hypothetical protein